MMIKIAEKYNFYRYTFPNSADMAVQRAKSAKWNKTLDKR